MYLLARPSGAPASGSRPVLRRIPQTMSAESPFHELPRASAHRDVLGEERHLDVALDPREPRLLEGGEDDGGRYAALDGFPVVAHEVAGGAPPAAAAGGQGDEAAQVEGQEPEGEPLAGRGDLQDQRPGAGAEP